MKETRRSECDSESGIKKMSIGHHLGWEYEGRKGVDEKGAGGGRTREVESRREWGRRESEWWNR